MTVARLESGAFELESEAGHGLQAVARDETPDAAALEVHLRLVQLFIQSRKPDEAAPHLRILAEATPDDPRLWGPLAVRLRQDDLCEAAMAVWTRALAAGIEPAKARLNLGQMLAALGRPDEALVHLHETLRAWSDPGPKALRRLATAFEQAGESAEAVELRRRAAELDTAEAGAPDAPVASEPAPLTQVVPPPAAEVIPLAARTRPARILVIEPDAGSPLEACLRALRPQDDIQAATGAAGSETDGYDVAIRVPQIDFSGFHPDIRRRGTRVYHSGLIMAAFAMGLPRAEVFGLFSGSVYRALGYFDAYARDEALLLASADAVGLDLRPVLAELTGQAFVHVPRRPTVGFHWALARRICEQHGLDTDPHAEAPADPYLAQARWPVYPKIAEQLGVPSSLRFKPAISETAPELSLDQLIDQAWRVYGADPQIVRGPQTVETVRILRQLGL